MRVYTSRRLLRVGLKRMRLFFAFLLSAPVSIVASQEPSRATQVERAAAIYAAAHFSVGRVAFDPAPADVQSVQISRSSSDIAELAKLLKATSVAGQQTIISCADRNPSTCKMNGADLLVKIGTPSFVGDTAFVIVRTYRPTHSLRTPIVRADIKLRAERRETGWVITSELPGSIS